MRWRGVTATALASLVMALAAGPAAAGTQEFTPRSEYEQLTERRKPLPSIPEEYRRFVAAASPDRLEVRGLRGQSIAVDMEWYEAEEFRQFQGGRFLGVLLHGYEAFGYLLVDRAARGAAAIIETGDAPVFSPDGRHFAAVQLSDAGWGNLEGVALWEVGRDGSTRRLFSDALPHAQDWRIERWHRADCLALSSTLPGWSPEPDQDWDAAIRRAPRVHYAIEIADGIALRALHQEQACAEGPRP